MQKKNSRKEKEKYIYKIFLHNINPRRKYIL